MSHSNDKKDRRKSPRYSVRQVNTIPISIERLDSQLLRGTLLDFSEQGARFSVETPPRFSESVLLNLVLKPLDISLRIDASVVWTRATPDGKWTVGCTFDKPIPSIVVERLARVGLIDRRTHCRISTNVAGVARWQLCAEASHVTITDYSVGGFCMVCDTIQAVGTTVRVQFASGESVFGVVKWNSTRGTKFLHGCEFLSISQQQNQGASVIREHSCAEALEHETFLSLLALQD